MRTGTLILIYAVGALGGLAYKKVKKHALDERVRDRTDPDSWTVADLADLVAAKQEAIERDRQRNIRAGRVADFITEPVKS